MEEKTFLSPSIKAILIFTIILLTGILIIVIGNPSQKTLILELSPSLSPSILKSPTPSETLNTLGDNSKFSGWKKESDEINGYQFNYPGDLDIINGDLRVSVATENTDLEGLPLECPTRSFDGFSDEFEGKKAVISDIEYCEYSTAERAAGTIIGYSIYSTINNKMLYIVSISIALRNCENFCTTDDLEKCKKQQEIISCTAENNAKLDLAKKILSTFKFIN